MIHKIQPFSRAALLAGFRQHAFAQVPALLAPHAVEIAVQRFFAFLELPDHIKKPLAYKHSNGRRGGSAGYKRSLPKPPQDPDSKEVFHFHPSMLRQWEQERKQCAELNALIESGQELYAASCGIVRKVASAFEQDVPTLTEQFFPRGKDPFIHVRFLRYYLTQQEEGAFMAVGHYDIGSLTIAFAESAPGLRIGGDIGTHLERMTPVVHHPGTAILMPAWNLPTEVPHCGIVPAWHDVVQQPGQAVNKTTAQWAIVVFADTDQVHTPSWGQAKIRRGTPPHEQLKLFA